MWDLIVFLFIALLFTSSVYFFPYLGKTKGEVYDKFIAARPKLELLFNLSSFTLFFSYCFF